MGIVLYCLCGNIFGSISHMILLVELVSHTRSIHCSTTVVYLYHLSLCLFYVLLWHTPSGRRVRAHARRRHPASLMFYGRSTGMISYLISQFVRIWYQHLPVWVICCIVASLCVLLCVIRRIDTQPAKGCVRQHQAHAWTWIASRSSMDYTIKVLSCACHLFSHFSLRYSFFMWNVFNSFLLLLLYQIILVWHS